MGGLEVEGEGALSTLGSMALEAPHYLPPTRALRTSLRQSKGTGSYRTTFSLPLWGFSLIFLGG